MAGFMVLNTNWFTINWTMQQAGDFAFTVVGVFAIAGLLWMIWHALSR